MSELEAPAYFDWRTTEKRTFILSLGNQAPSSEKYRLEWYIEHPSTGADLRHVALIDKSNPFVGKVTLPKYADKVFIKLITPEAQSSIQEFAAGPTTSHTFFSGKRNMKMSAITSISQLGADIDGEADGDDSGYSVSLSSNGQTVAIGARFNDGNGYNAGHVRIYSFNGSSWSQLGQDIDGEAAGDYSGYSVSLSSDGQTVAIGAYRNDGNGSYAGHVRVYSFNGSSWNQLGQDIDGEAYGDYSGLSVSLSSDGQTVAIGAPGNDGNGNGSGHVRIYSLNGSSWTKLGQDIDGEAYGDDSGWSVSLSSDGQTVAIGAPYNGPYAGHVRVYSFNGSSWNQVGQDIDGEAVGDFSGYSVSLSSDGSILAIGAYRNNGNGTRAGHVRIYSFNGSSWSQLGQDIDGEAAGDYSGRSVSLSSDGQTVAIGAPYNGSNAGHVRVYSFNGSSWNQLGQDIDGEAAGDDSGYSVSLSSDGQTVAIGAYRNDGNGTDAGHVRVYSLGPPAPADSDGDGVADASDNYPNDITRAYDSFNPSENSFGTAMFEDLWPHEGDYDFNDLVVSWRQQLVSNADNKIVEAKIKVVKVARGGSLESGFGLKLGTVPSNKVASVTGCELSGFATIGANGVEDGQTYANIIFWDKISQAWPNTTGASMQNTISANPHSTEDTTEIVVTFTEPIEGTLLNNGGPYIWVNNERGREIHPAGSAPTDLVDPSYFGTGSDNSDPNDVTTMYKGNGNRPWALVIFEETAQTEEKVDFTEAYLKFSDWALSSGGSYNDWYQDEAGYRGSSSKFYTK
jgi:LruC domain-containing protein